VLQPVPKLARGADCTTKPQASSSTRGGTREKIGTQQWMGHHEWVGTPGMRHTDRQLQCWSLPDKLAPTQGCCSGEISLPAGERKFRRQSKVQTRTNDKRAPSDQSDRGAWPRQRPGAKRTDDGRRMQMGPWQNWPANMPREVEAGCCHGCRAPKYCILVWRLDARIRPINPNKPLHHTTCATELAPQGHALAPLNWSGNAVHPPRNFGGCEVPVATTHAETADSWRARFWLPLACDLRGTRN